jgi:hypothetical protein
MYCRLSQLFHSWFTNSSLPSANLALYTQPQSWVSTPYSIYIWSSSSMATYSILHGFIGSHDTSLFQVDGRKYWRYEGFIPTVSMDLCVIVYTYTGGDLSSLHNQTVELNVHTGCLNALAFVFELYIGPWSAYCCNYMVSVAATRLTAGRLWQPQSIPFLASSVWVVVMKATVSARLWSLTGFKLSS